MIVGHIVTAVQCNWSFVIQKMVIEECCFGLAIYYLFELTLCIFFDRVLRTSYFFPIFSSELVRTSWF